jgi:hypothetical protein
LFFPRGQAPRSFDELIGRDDQRISDGQIVLVEIEPVAGAYILFTAADYAIYRV